MNTAYIFELCHTQLLLQFCLHSCSVCKTLLPTDYCKFDRPVYMCMLPSLYSVIYTDCQYQQDLFMNLSSSSEIWITQQGTPSLAIKLKYLVMLFSVGDGFQCLGPFSCLQWLADFCWWIWLQVCGDTTRQTGLSDLPSCGSNSTPSDMLWEGLLQFLPESIQEALSQLSKLQEKRTGLPWHQRWVDFRSLLKKKSAVQFSTEISFPRWAGNQGT